MAFLEKEKDLFIELMHINKTLEKAKIFKDGRDKQRVTMNFFQVVQAIDQEIRNQILHSYIVQTEHY